MTRARNLGIAAGALCAAWLSAGCSREAESFTPPVQKAALLVPKAGELGYFLTMADPHADAYIVQDVAPSGPGTWRWVYDHPVLQFLVPAVPRLKFVMDFSLPERTLRETGPVTLTFSINGRLLDRLRCEQGGELHYAHDVPPDMLRANAINRVAVDPNPVWVSKADGGRLGFILSRAGFTE
ncbi:MAG: hypothetical protein ABI759_28825 [Candidatus Solibacter sp.]